MWSLSKHCHRRSLAQIQVRLSHYLDDLLTGWDNNFRYSKKCRYLTLHSGLRLVEVLVPSYCYMISSKHTCLQSPCHYQFANFQQIIPLSRSIKRTIFACNLYAFSFPANSALFWPLTSSAQMTTWFLPARSFNPFSLDRAIIFHSLPLLKYHSESV